MYQGCGWNRLCLLKRAEEVPVSTSHSVEQRIQVGEEGQMVVEEGME